MPKPAPRQGPGRPKDLDKRAAVLTAAKTLFAQRGFDSVSMEAIATAAGVSKLTVYSHFTDKDTLFQAAVRSKCEEALPESVFDVSLRGDVRERLRAIARGFHQLVMSDESLGLHRLLIAQGASNTKLVELFYDSGPRRVISAFQTFLQGAQQSGELDIPDPARAASHFFCLLKGEGHMLQLLGCPLCVTSCDPQQHIDSVLELFLRAYLPR
ncbi:MAG: HTH-type transcriptional repressor ComR [Alphaproteobacteria bacterium ADurb.BinA280]|jgi:TetR/AcrR family transcriptional regulator, mexJK operon transcriptional repressor|nr:TetR/AcrR family transcriptional regulator [Xanthomonadales bacterium]MCC6504734.1 TetR/AcrR family transcriptional regulator [Aquimonas sp.]OPZ12397.1 MAG: HTH-type transcriptional repressor ComR [Alphaproteobacteria bacterium ADurb.BinA280]